MGQHWRYKLKKLLIDFEMGKTTIDQIENFVAGEFESNRLEKLMPEIVETVKKPTDKIESEEILNELSRQYLGNFFEDKEFKGLFQIVDCIKEPGYVLATNGRRIIKREISKIIIKGV